MTDLIHIIVEEFGNILEGERGEQTVKLRRELTVCQQKRKLQENGTTKMLAAMETLKNHGKGVHPSIYILLQIVCTLPATNKTAFFFIAKH